MIHTPHSLESRARAPCERSKLTHTHPVRTHTQRETMEPHDQSLKKGRRACACTYCTYDAAYASGRQEGRFWRRSSLPLRGLLKGMEGWRGEGERERQGTCVSCGRTDTQSLPPWKLSLCSFFARRFQKDHAARDASPWGGAEGVEESWQGLV